MLGILPGPFSRFAPNMYPPTCSSIHVLNTRLLSRFLCQGFYQDIEKEDMSLPPKTTESSTFLSIFLHYFTYFASSMALSGRSPAVVLAVHSGSLTRGSQKTQNLTFIHHVTLSLTLLGSLFSHLYWDWMTDDGLRGPFLLQ